MKSPVVAGLLWLLLGLAGAHRFYLHMSYLWMLGLFLVVLVAPFKVFTGGALLVWWLVDGVMLLEWVHRYNEEQRPIEQ